MGKYQRNRLVGKLLQEGNKRIKLSFEALLNGEMISSPIEEQIVYNQLEIMKWQSGVCCWQVGI